MTTFKQSHDYGKHGWPSGLPRSAATFAISPEELTARTGLVFASGCDDLDNFRAAGVALPSGRYALLLWYDRAPVRSMELMIDSADVPGAACREAMSAFDISPAEVTWQPDDTVLEDLVVVGASAGGRSCVEICISFLSTDEAVAADAPSSSIDPLGEELGP